MEGSKRLFIAKRQGMKFLLLACAILAEVTGTTALKFSQGFTRLLPSLIVIVGYGVSFYLLSITLKKMDIGVVYAIWSAVGTALVATISMQILHQDLIAFCAHM